MKQFLVFTFILSILTACKKPEERTCFKRTGDIDTLEVSVGGFDKLFLHEHVEYELIQDSLDKVVLVGGKNLLGEIQLTVNEGLLDISNHNRCNFLRDYQKKVKAEIHFTNIINIHFEGTETLANRDMLQFDWLTFLIRDGAGPVKLNFNAQYVNAIVSHGWGDFTFKGTVNQANLNVRSNGYCDTYGMKVLDSLTVISNTQGTVKVNANGAKLKAQTEADGNILYKGVPSSIQFNQIGAGSLIDSN
jgi:hypothetical protein